MNKRKLCDHILKKMEWWRHASWAEHIDEKTKDDVITVMDNVIDGIANNRQSYKEES